MATVEQERAEHEALRKLLEELAGTKPDQLIRTDELGSSLNFKPGLPFFERMLWLFRTLSESNLDNVPYTVLNKLKNLSLQLKTQVDQVKQFSPNVNNPTAVRDTLIYWFRDNYDGYFIEISPVIAYSIRKGTDFELLEKKARESLIQIEAVVKEIEEHGRDAAAETELTLQKVRQAAAEVGVAQHATHFQLEAKNHSETAAKWLIATIVAGFITVVWGIFSFKFHPVPMSSPPTTTELVESFASKLMVLSVLYYVLVWAGKNYGAHRHNFVVNKHRQNALSTFETFVKAAGEDIDTKNAVLLQATQSIFSSQSSGYINRDNDQESPNKIIEIMRNVSSLGKGN